MTLGFTWSFDNRSWCYPFIIIEFSRDHPVTTLFLRRFGWPLHGSRGEVATGLIVTIYCVVVFRIIHRESWIVCLSCTHTEPLMFVKQKPVEQLAPLIGWTHARVITISVWHAPTSLKIKEINPVPNDVGAYHTYCVWYKPMLIWNWTARTVQPRVFWITHDLSCPLRTGPSHVWFVGG